jgi:hypothetical protein
MRTILKLSVWLLVCAPITAHADFGLKQVHAALQPTKVTFSYSGFRSFYSCDFAERETKLMLTKLGAVDIKVRCSGGLPYQSSLWVDSTFATIHEVPTDKSDKFAEITDVGLDYRDSCDFHKTIFDGVISKFQVYAKKVSESCWYSEGQFRAKVSTLK